MLPGTSVVSNIGEQAVTKNKDPQKTPTQTPRTHRIFNQTSPSRETARSPQKLLQSDIKQLNSTRYRSPNSCNIYYKQQYGLTRSPIHGSISPEKLTLIKTNQMLEYENNLLLKQLQQRDDVIQMYKNGYISNTVPINEQIVKNLNLRLSQKNVLIQQIHRILVQFSQQITKQKIQVSSLCSQKMKTILNLIEEHEHYPIIIRQRIIDTSQSAQRVYIREDTGHDWQVKMQKSYLELVTIKQRLEWFQKQNNILQSTITNLKTQKQPNINQDPYFYKLQAQKLSTELTLLQQQSIHHKHQITNLTQTISQLNKNYKPIPIPTHNPEISRLRQQIKKYQNKVLQLVEKDKEINVLRETIQRFKNQIVVFKTREVRIQGENMEMKGIIDQLRSQLDVLSMQKDNNINNDPMEKLYKLRIDELENQLQFANLKVKQLIKQNKICSDEATKWRKHLEQAEDYIENLLNQLQKIKKQTPQQPHHETSSLTIQISNLLQKIQNLRQQCNNLKLQQAKMHQASEQHKLEIKQYTHRIQSLVKERDSQVKKLRDLLDKNQREYQINLQQIQGKVRRQSEGLIANLNSQIQSINKNKQSQFTKISQEYQSKITKITTQLQTSQKQLIIYKQSKSSKQWEQQLSALHQDYQRKLSETFSKLAKAQDYIFSMEEKTKLEISSLKSSLVQMEEENSTLKKLGSKNREQFMYKLDSKYGQVQSRLVALSQKSAQSIAAQAQFWEHYRAQRTKDLEEMSAIISDSLGIIGNVDQAVVIKRDQLYRLDFTELEQVLAQINKLRLTKQQLSASVRQNAETKFYGVLKSVSTQFMK